METEGFLVVKTLMKKLMHILIIVSLLIPICSSLISSSNVYGYNNVSAHRTFNAVIVDKFIERAASFTQFENYTFSMNYMDLRGPSITAAGYWDATTQERELTAREWIIEGGYSADEPEIPASYRHFYDPLGLNGGQLALSDLNFASAAMDNPVDAITWHFSGIDVNGNNAWSWENGKLYMEIALESSNEKTRNNNLAMAFRCLGEVLHNTADMGCPPHVRNDAHGGYTGVGGSDPYESGFNPAWVAQYAGDSCDPYLKAEFENADQAIDINRALAEFTNEYFFSDETISGNGYSSRNEMQDYPAPKLDNLIYDEVSSNYVYAFPSGRRVQLCTHKSVFMDYIYGEQYPGYPRITLENVQSQASELVPTIVEAGVHVVKNFIPVFEVTLQLDQSKKELSGQIIHITTAEYPVAIKYNGLVEFFIDNSLTNIETQAANGYFSIIVPDLKGGEEIAACFSFGGILVMSPEITAAMPITTPTPTPTTAQSGTCADTACDQSKIGNGECDYYCDNTPCNRDGGDCCGYHCDRRWIGDGVCDTGCMYADCQYDGGDCDEICDDVVPGCLSKSGDGQCDSDCNYAECGYDGGDCSATPTTTTSPTATAAPTTQAGNCDSSCPSYMIGDHVCDWFCFNAGCQYDGGDCDYYCEETHWRCQSQWLGDGKCDSDCNYAECGYDEGDCN